MEDASGTRSYSQLKACKELRHEGHLEALGFVRNLREWMGRSDGCRDELETKR